MSKSSRKKKPSRKNLVRAVALPTLRHLFLIEGYDNDTHLTARGSVLLNNSLNSDLKVDEKKFRKEFAKYILKLEDRYFIPVTKYIFEISNKNDVFIRSDLLNVLEKINNDKKITRDRFSRWLSYLSYVGFIKKIRNSNKYMFIKYQIKSASFTDHPPSEKEFKGILVNAYKNEAQKSTNLGYVPIPTLRDFVCIEFNGRLWDEEFYDYLKKIRGEDDNYIISFAEPMTRKAGGIRIDGIYYYYMFIRTKE